MAMPIDAARQVSAPWTRVLILLTALAVAAAISFRLTGSVIPTSSSAALIFQSSLLFVVLGSALIESTFTRPADAAVNGLMGAISLVTVYASAPRHTWWLVFAYCILVFVLALTCVVVSEHPGIVGWRRSLRDFTYRPSIVLGRARVLYSVVFLYAVFAFYGMRSAEAAVLVLFWGVFVALWPLQVPQLLGRISPRRSRPAIGRVVRVDSPGVVRIELSGSSIGDESLQLIYQAADGLQHDLHAVYRQDANERPVATALAVGIRAERIPGLDPGAVYRLEDPALTEQDVSARYGGTAGSVLIGFVVEESHIADIRFETWRCDLCREGLLVWSEIDGRRVYFQITDGVTQEEGLEGNRHGFQYAVAGQLGTFEAGAGFAKHPWLPRMNSPVFCESEGFGGDLDACKPDDFRFGTLPGTAISVGGPFCASMDHHTAILGVTGSGKTELAFDLIRAAVGQGIKVVCIDLTARYGQQFNDLSPTDLSISGQLATDLSEKLFEAETGKFGGGEEKKALKEFATSLRADVETSVKGFVEKPDAKIGIITLDEISNTKASLFITEMYMSCLLRYARTNGGSCPRVLVVVEEAHTVMPEPSTMGLGDYESRGLVGKISQIALQGRKYKIGLLIVAQRTATVSKTVLTQCNTVIALGCYDQTSVEFLSNVFGEAHAKLVPRLPRLHAVGFGRAFRSQRPVMFQIPYVASKASN